MAPSDDRKWEDNGPIDAGDLPPSGHKVGREHNDHHEHEKADDERQPETAHGAWDLDKDVGPFDLFLRRAPRDVVREKVREEVADLQEWDPDNVLEERGDECS